MVELTLSSVHGAQVGVLSIEAIEYMCCLFEAVDVLERSEYDNDARYNYDQYDLSLEKMIN